MDHQAQGAAIERVRAVAETGVVDDAEGSLCDGRVAVVAAVVPVENDGSPSGFFDRGGAVAEIDADPDRAAHDIIFEFDVVVACIAGEVEAGDAGGDAAGKVCKLDDLEV